MLAERVKLLPDKDQAAGEYDINQNTQFLAFKESVHVWCCFRPTVACTRIASDACTQLRASDHTGI
jgi:hypothetical protein